MTSVLPPPGPEGDHSTIEPWERIQHLLETNQTVALAAFLASLDAGEMALVLSRLKDDQREEVLHILGVEEAADILEGLSHAQAAGILEDLPAEHAAAIVDELPSADQADVLSELTARDQAAILAEMAPSEASVARQLLEYDADTAGGIMITEYLAYPRLESVGQLVDNLRQFGDQFADYHIQYIYVRDADARLVGVLRLRDLLLSGTDQTLESIMLVDPVRVSTSASVHELADIFAEHGFMGMPVVDERERLVGVVRRSAVEEALRRQATSHYLKVTGLVGQDELRSMPLTRRSMRRLSWLTLNIGLNVISASVIAMYQDTLAAVIALAVFLPIISDMSGCSGNQAVAVSIRELSLGLLKPHEFTRVIFKEGGVGVINGMMLGVVLGGVAALWKSNLFLGIVVGGALMLNTMVAVLLGGIIPLTLKHFKFDPALASGPILTTVTDMVGFFLVLSLASAMLAHLTL
jgi:magnesium transporter